MKNVNLQFTPWPILWAMNFKQMNIHWKQQQISNHFSLLTSTDSFLTTFTQVKMIAIQNQSQGVTFASVRSFFYLPGTMRRPRIKKIRITNQSSIDVSEALLTSQGHRMNWVELTFMAPGNEAGTFNLTWPTQLWTLTPRSTAPMWSATSRDQ